MKVIIRGIVLTLAVLVGLVIVSYVSGTIYFVPEYQNVVVTRFGEVQYAVVTSNRFSDPGTTSAEEEDKEETEEELIKKLSERYSEGIIHTGAGLYFKVPFIERAHYLDSRILRWNGEPKEVSTRDLRTLSLNISARWRIADPIRFYEAIGEEIQAENRLGSIINSVVEDHVSETRLIETVRNQNLELDERIEERLETATEEETDIEVEEEVDAAQINYGRSELLRRIKEDVAREIKEQFGARLVDLMFTQINYTEDVRQRVYDRMRAERERIAARYRAQGERASREIRGQVNREENEIVSGAEREVQEILGAAERQSIRIWAGAYQEDPDFFAFQRSLKTYEESMGKNTYFLLSDDNQLMEYMTGVNTD
ncbi:MAG: protease modulator HflC [bacterium]